MKKTELEVKSSMEQLYHIVLDAKGKMKANVQQEITFEEKTLYVLIDAYLKGYTPKRLVDLLAAGIRIQVERWWGGLFIHFSIVWIFFLTMIAY